MIDSTHHSLTQDWTGLVSGHPMPAKVYNARCAMDEAWAELNAAQDANDEGRACFTRKELNDMGEIAKQAEAEYYRLRRVWDASLEDCECRPIDADRDYTCVSCRAKAELRGDQEMPY